MNCHPTDGLKRGSVNDDGMRLKDWWQPCYPKRQAKIDNYVILRDEETQFTNNVLRNMLLKVFDRLWG